MRPIAFISLMEGDPWGGSEELWSRTALQLRAQNVPVAVNFKAWPEPAKQLGRLKDAGCTITFRKYPSSLAARVIAKFQPYSPYRWLDSLDQHLVVFSQGANAECAGWAAQCVQRNIPYVIISNGAGVPYWPDDHAALAMREAYGHSRASFFPSRDTLELTRRQLAFEGPGFEVAWNPVNVPYDAAPLWPAQDSPLRLACVARVDVRIKGHDLLLELLGLPKWRSRPLTVTCFGTGPNQRLLGEYAQQQHLDSVSFAGFNPDIQSIWSGHHALILASRCEGLPLVVMEAMLCGRACIVTDVGGSREVIEDNVTGFLAGSPTVERLDEALERLWNCRGNLRAMGAAAAADIRQRIPRDAALDFATRLCELASRA